MSLCSDQLYVEIKDSQVFKACQFKNGWAQVHMKCIMFDKFCNKSIPLASLIGKMRSYGRGMLGSRQILGLYNWLYIYMRERERERLWIKNFLSVTKLTVSFLFPQTVHLTIYFHRDKINIRPGALYANQYSYKSNDFFVLNNE